jgi:sterol 3beta-glucosyltransferase
MLADAVTASQDAEAIIYAPLGFPGAHIAEATGVPAVLAALVPLTPTRSFPAAGAPAWPLDGAYHRLTHLVAEQLGWQPFRRLVNQWRRETLGLGPAPLRGLAATQRRRHAPVLYGYSPSILPKPPTGAPTCTSPATGLATPSPTGSRRPPWPASWPTGPHRSTSGSAA